MYPTKTWNKIKYLDSELDYVKLELQMFDALNLSENINN